MASNWFYGMAGGCMLGLIILFCLQPIDFNHILIKRLKKMGIEIQYNPKIEKKKKENKENLLLVDCSTKTVAGNYQIDSMKFDENNNNNNNNNNNSNNNNNKISVDNDVIKYIGNNEENLNGNNSKNHLIDQIPDESKA